MTVPPAPILVAGDTEPALDIRLVRRGQPVDVTGMLPVARVDREGLDVLERPLAIVDGPGGIVRLAWLPGDLEAAPDGGVADYRLEVDIGDATNAVPYRFRVRPRIGA